MNITHIVYFSDSLLNMHLVPDRSIDLILTDPPYGQNYSTGRRKRTIRGTTRIANDAGQLDIARLMREFDRVTKPQSHCYVFTSWKTVDLWKPELEKYFTLKNILIWSKDNHTAGDLAWSYAQSYEMILFAMKGRKKLRGSRDRDSVYVPKVKTHQQAHLLQKPEKLVEYLIRKSSRIGDTILDPFAGSGTTGYCCRILHRHSIQFELEKQYRSSILRRLQGEGSDPRYPHQVIVAR
jgi:site-specific DNA-methyltransferase (adenine-specific)